MKKNRTFKTKIVISYILIVFIVGVIFSITHYLLTLQSFIKLNEDEKSLLKTVLSIVVIYSIKV